MIDANRNYWFASISVLRQVVIYWEYPTFAYISDIIIGGCQVKLIYTITIDMEVKQKNTALRPLLASRRPWKL